MKLLPLLALAVLMLTNNCSLAEELRDSGAAEGVILEVTWGDPDKPECQLLGEVSSDGLFAVKSKDGKHVAGGKVGIPNDKGYPIALTLFTWRSENSHELQSLEPRVQLGRPHDWTTVTGVARRYRITLSGATRSEAGRPKTTTEQAGAGQTATRPESKLEGGDKPKPKSEGRSR